MATKKTIKKAVKKTVKKSVKKSTGGRRRYEPSEEHFETCYIGAKKGLNYQQIAESIGISLKTFQRRIDLFRPHLKKGHDESDDKNCEKVESALLKKCLGYEHVEVWVEKKLDAKGETVSSTQKQVKKFYPPSDVAIFFYLCNKASDKWQSINKPIIDEDKSKGEIQGWFDMMKSQYNQMIANNGKTKR